MTTTNGVPPEPWPVYLQILLVGLQALLWIAAALAAIQLGQSYLLSDTIQSWRIVPWLKTLAFIAVPFTVAPFYAEEAVKLYRDLRARQHSAYDERRRLREETRSFAEFLEDQYGWLFEMPELEQQQRALLWYEQVVTRWETENNAFHELRKSDARDLVIEDLGPLGDRMLTVWSLRRALYQYAIAYTNEATRAAELLKIHRQIQLQKVHAARARVEDERILTPLMKPDTDDEATA